jgi:LysR family glycine cleavage system transcriptional activator
MKFLHYPSMTRLPPLDALIAFDATARHGSMTSAAIELGLTQSAISHRVRRLEEFMGTALFERKSSSLVPTPAGTAILSNLSTIIKEMSGLRPRCLSAAGPDRLRLGVSSALAENWLVSRLPGFTAQFPQISIELTIIENEASVRDADLCIHVLWVPAHQLRSTSTQQPLFREAVFPVCHPSLLPADFTPGDHSILSRLPLLHKGQADRDHAAEWSWTNWLERLGLPSRADDNLRFMNIGPAISAAEAGAGVALARSMLVHDALTEDRLVRVLPPQYDMLSSKVHVVRWPAALCRDERVKSFSSWLSNKAKETASNWHGWGQNEFPSQPFLQRPFEERTARLPPIG